MKKVFLLISISLLLFLASCAREKTVVCTYQGSNYLDNETMLISFKDDQLTRLKGNGLDLNIEDNPEELELQTESLLLSFDTDTVEEAIEELIKEAPTEDYLCEYE